MKKLLYLLLAVNFIGLAGLKAQSTEQPLNNFYVDKDDITVKYQQVMEAPNMTAKTLALKIKGLLLKSDNIEKMELDTANNILTGHLKNIVPKYYQSSHSKELVADFTVEVKDGKYRVFIHDMYWQSNVTGVPMGYYGMGYGGSGKERFEGMTINKKGTKWMDFAYDVLPDLNDIFTKKFSLSSSDSKW